MDNSHLIGFGPTRVTQNVGQIEMKGHRNMVKDPLRRPLKYGKSQHTISWQSDETKNVLQIIYTNTGSSTNCLGDRLKAKIISFFGLFSDLSTWPEMKSK